MDQILKFLLLTMTIFSSKSNFSLSKSIYNCMNHYEDCLINSLVSNLIFLTTMDSLCIDLIFILDPQFMSIYLKVSNFL
jgi:hypothetical protein